MTQVRIESDGNPTNTLVYVEDTLLTCVTAVTWQIKTHGLAKATITIDDVAIRATDTLASIERQLTNEQQAATIRRIEGERTPLVSERECAPAKEWATPTLKP